MTVSTVALLIAAVNEAKANQAAALITFERRIVIAKLSKSWVIAISYLLKCVNKVDSQNADRIKEQKVDCCARTSAAAHYGQQNSDDMDIHHYESES